MNSKVILAAMMISAAPALAANKIPDICKTAANYAAQTASIRYQEGSGSDEYNPKTLKLKRDHKAFPAKYKFLGNCDEDGAKLKTEWCEVAGGSPDVYQAEVSAFGVPTINVIVTYNRSGCWVDEVTRK
jgi:hypothetical protein